MHSRSSLKLHRPRQEGVCSAGAGRGAAAGALHPGAQAGPGARRPRSAGVTPPRVTGGLAARCASASLGDCPGRRT